MTMTYHREIPPAEDPYRGYHSMAAMRAALAKAGVGFGMYAHRKDLAVLLDEHGLAYCRHFFRGGGMEQRRLRCQQLQGHPGQCYYYRKSGQGGTYTRWWGANPEPGKTTPGKPGRPEADPCTALRELRWAPYQEFGIPDPAAETCDPPSGPVRIGSTGYRGDDIIVYWERA